LFVNFYIYIFNQQRFRAGVCHEKQLP
jgi:hypothetical protein